MLGACKATKMVPEGSYLLVKNKLKTTDSGNTLFSKVLSKLDDEKALYIKHKPNKSLIVLGRFHLGIYNLVSSKKHPEKNESSKLRRKLREFGEAPVLLDSTSIIRSQINLRNYLFSKGYFNSDVTYSVEYKGKKAYVTYYIIPKHPYLVNQVFLSADDADIDSLLNSNLSSTLFAKGKAVELETINLERNRLTNQLRNNGYFDFSKDYIDFELDTNLNTHTVDVIITVSNKNEQERFIRKVIKNVNVIFVNDSETQVDQGRMVYDSINFFFNGFPIHPEVIAKSISIKKGDYFRNNDIENTYTRLSELPVFKFIDINLVNSPEDSLNGLNADIILKTNYRQSFTIEPQGIMSQLNRIQNINFGNTFGIANSLIWTHRNLFKNAELFEVSSNTRLETQLLRSTTTNQLQYFNFAVQQSISLSLSIPKSTLLNYVQNRDFLWGKIKSSYLKQTVKSIKTNLIFSLLYERNPDYLRRIIPMTYQYQLISKRFTWLLNVFEMSFSKNSLAIDISGRADSAFIQRLFTNSLITSSGLSFLYTDKNTTKSRTHFFIRANAIELSGNIHRLIRKAIDNTNNRDTSYKLFNVNYYNYIKSEIDVRCSTYLSDKASTAFRLNIGLAYPYGNQKITPFDKLFYIGGANSLRAWRPRTIGPGSYAESSKNFRIDRAGDLIMLFNAEVRRDLIDKKVEGALFVDAGNVWLIRKDVNPNSPKTFDWKGFLAQTGINTGVGIRLDFTYFLFRLDWGMQVYNPEKSLSQAWVIKSFAKDKYFTKYSILNFGIGYPF